MSEKQDRQGVRTAADLERKYKMNWGKPFAELTGISKDVRQQVDRVETELRGDMNEGFESAAAQTEERIEAALALYAKRSELEAHKQTAEQALQDLSGRISAAESGAGLAAYPVGSIYFTFSETAPDVLFGGTGGTWELLSDALTLPGAEGEDAAHFSAWRRIS